MGQHRVAIIWAALGGVLTLAFVAVVVLLNATVYSASGFTHSYLNALARHDVAAALELAGPSETPGAGHARRDLLDSRALGGLSNIRAVSDIDQGDGVHAVRFRYTLSSRDGTKSAEAETTFRVSRHGLQMGLFSAWQFATSPVGTLTVTPRHGSGFTVNGLQLTSGNPGHASDQLTFTPALYVLGHESNYFTARKEFAVLRTSGEAAKATVDIQANADFVDQIQKGLDTELAKCATQKVLLPTGCPFGKQVRDRIEDAPQWSIVRNPAVKILPGGTPGTWQVPSASGVAHVTVKVRSIFDGSVTTLDEDVPFSVSYAIGFNANGQLVFTST